MAATFNLQIVTPDREVFNAAVESVTLPGMQGGFGVMRSHAPLIAALETGTVGIFDSNGRQMKMAVGGGFFEVASNLAILLADSAEFATDIDVPRAQAAEQRARSRLAGKLEPEQQVQRDRAEAALKRARVRLRVAAGL